MVIHPGKIEIKNLGFECILGTLPFERTTLQPIILNVTLEFDFLDAAKTESIECTIDYASLAQELETFISDSKFQLVETLVFKTAKKILEKYRRVLAVSVRVEKLKAIPKAQAAVAEIRLER